MKTTPKSLSLLLLSVVLGIAAGCGTNAPKNSKPAKATEENTIHIDPATLDAVLKDEAKRNPAFKQEKERLETIFHSEEAQRINERIKVMARQGVSGLNSENRSELIKYARDISKPEELREMVVRAFSFVPTKANFQTMVSFLNDPSDKVRGGAYYQLPEAIRGKFVYDYTRVHSEQEFKEILGKVEPLIEEYFSTQKR